MTGSPIHILISEPIHEVGIEWLRDQGAVPVLMYEDQHWERVAGRAKAIIVRSFKIDSLVLEQLPSLEVVGKYGVGFNTIDLDATASRGVKVTSVPGANARAVAELAVTLLLAVARDLIVADGLVRQDRFGDRFQLRFMKELSDSRVGVIGAGRIGRRIADICRGGFQCAIAFYDPFVSLADRGSSEFFDDVRELCVWADNLVIAAPLTKSTRGLIGAEELVLLGSGGIVVASSRGGIVDESALAHAVKSGIIRGAGLDVYQDEPPAADNPLFGIPGIVLTPHVGGATDKSREQMAIDVTRNVWALLHGAEAPLVGTEPWA